MTASKHPETLVLHAGHRADATTGAVAVPIYQTTSYQFDSTPSTPPTSSPEGARQHLHPHHEPDDGGAGRSASRRWRAASPRWRSPRARPPRPCALQNIAKAGDNIVSSTDLYGGTWNLFANTLKTMGIEVRFVDPADPENFAAPPTTSTRAYYAETLPNPKLTVFPIAEVAKIGRSSACR
jgi:O-acetylhomoserine (thiol)-lyase